MNAFKNISKFSSLMVKANLRPNFIRPQFASFASEQAYEKCM